MAENFSHISHRKSNETRTITENEYYGLTPTANNTDSGDNVSPVKLNIGKRPSADDVIDGEIAINYLKGHETICIRNTENEIVGFPNENEINESQSILASAIGDEKTKRENAVFEINNTLNDIKTNGLSITDGPTLSKTELNMGTLVIDSTSLKTGNTTLDGSGLTIKNGASVTDKEIKINNTSVSSIGISLGANSNTIIKEGSITIGNTTMTSDTLTIGTINVGKSAFVVNGGSMPTMDFGNGIIFANKEQNLLFLGTNYGGDTYTKLCLNGVTFSFDDTNSTITFSNGNKKYTITLS